MFFAVPVFYRTMSNYNSSRSRYAWVIVAVSTLALIISNGLTIGGIPVFYKPMQDEFIASGAVAADRAQTFISTGATLTFLLSGVFSMLGGWLMLRIGLKRLMLIGCVCLGGGLLLHAVAASVWVVYLSRFLMGVSLGFVGVTPNVVLVSNWFRERRGTALGIMLTGTSIGGFLIPLIATPMILQFGWRTAMLLLSMSVWLLLLPAVIFIVREAPDVIDDQPVDGMTGSTLREALRMPIFWVFALCAALVFYPIFVTTQQFILYLQSPKIGMDLRMASWLQSLLFAVSVGGKSLAGSVSDRIPATRVMLMCAAVMFLSTTVLFGLTAGNAPLFLIPFGLGYGGTFVLLQRLASDYFGMKEYGKILGTIVMVEIGGAFIGGQVTGYLADKAGGDYTLAFYGVAIVTVGVLLCTVLLNIMYRRDRFAAG
jgi:MFS family permease